MTNEIVNQIDIVAYGETNNLGSKKSILSLISEFIENKLIQEVELPTTSPGRPKKGYSKIKEKEIDLITFNLSELPSPLYEFVQEESSKEKITPNQVITRLISWSYNFLLSTPYTDSKPIENLPEHLKKASNLDFKFTNQL
jgi:hypothetical protein